MSKLNELAELLKSAKKSTVILPEPIIEETIP